VKLVNSTTDSLNKTWTGPFNCLFDIQSGNGTGLFFQTRSPHAADHYAQSQNSIKALQDSSASFTS